MSQDSILSLVQDGVLELIINRPERKNALTLAMYTQLAAELRKAASTETVAVVMIRGEGGDFSSGNDLKDFMNNPPKGYDAPVFDFLQILATFPKPLLCSVDGYAVGIGTTMLLHADIVYASPQARFQLPFINLGLVPEAAASLLLPAAAGMKIAHELLLFGEAFDAKAAESYGVINRVVADGDVHAYTRSRAKLLAQKPRAALIDSKALLKKVHEPAVLAQLTREGDVFMKYLDSPETLKAIQAFFSKKT